MRQRGLGALVAAFLVLEVLSVAQASHIKRLRPPFALGVAARAGSTSAMLWSRGNEERSYRYQVARDQGFDRVVAAGRVTANDFEDYTLKAVVRRLTPATRYYYRFLAGERRSATGTFETLPRSDRPAGLSLAYSGDSDVLWTEHPDPDAKPFEVLTRVAEEEPDLFLYFGDTIYSDSETGASPALSITHKWRKYRRNRIGPTRRVLRSVSTWAGWDDHEVINDFDGAVLQATDPDLFQAGFDAFNHYWPVHENRYYRKVDVGSKVDLIFLDERSYRSQSADETDSPCRDDEGDLDFVPTMPPQNRAELGLSPADPQCIAHIEDPERSMLGAEQLQWLKDTLAASSATWKLIVNNVPITQIYALPYDRWEGYAAEREQVLQFIADSSIENVVFLTTDLHTNVGARVYVDIDEDSSTPVAYEGIAGPIQTCTLECEVDRLVGEGQAQVLRGFLRARGLIDDDCIELNEYGYATVDIPADAGRLVFRWRSNKRRSGGGGRFVEACQEPVVLRPGDFG